MRRLRPCLAGALTLIGTACCSMIVLLVASAAEADEPAFGGRRGIGGIKTFAFPLSLDDKMGTFNGNPYRPGWSEEMLSGRLLELRQAGFDFIRLNIDPGPLLAADPTGLDRLISEIDFALTSTLAAGLKVVLDIHPSDGHPAWGAEKITSGTSQPVFQRYLGIVRRAARLVDGFDPRLAALELFNEPPSPCQWPGNLSWPEQLKILHREARRLAPRHTLIVAGACYAKIDGLLLLDGASFDANTMFTVHYYEPHIFTHQGYWASSDKYLQYIAPLPYPALPGMGTATLARVKSALSRATDLTAGERSLEWSKARRKLEDYFAEPSGIQAVEARFAEINAWASRHGVAPARIVVGEFGVMKDIYDKTGARPADRMAWLADVRATAEKFGFAWSAWALTNTMGIVTRDLDGPLDPDVLSALGLVTPKPSPR